MGLSIMKVGAPRCSIVHQHTHINMALQDTKQDLTLADIDHVEGKDRGTVEHDEFVGQFAEQEAHEETPWQALKSHPWSSVWVLYGIGIIIACSFDNNAGGNVISIPRFRQDYGSPFDGNYRMCFQRSGNRLIRVDPLRRPSLERLEVAVSFTILPEPAPLAALWG